MFPLPTGILLGEVPYATCDLCLIFSFRLPVYFNLRSFWGPQQLRGTKVETPFMWGLQRWVCLRACIGTFVFVRTLEFLTIRPRLSSSGQPSVSDQRLDFSKNKYIVPTSQSQRRFSSSTPVKNPLHFLFSHWSKDISLQSRVPDLKLAHAFSWWEPGRIVGGQAW